MDVFATVYPAELKSFGVDVVVVVPGIIKTGGPARTAAALSRVSDQMSSEQRKLYGRSFDTFATALNSMQSSDCDSASADKVIELAERIPASSRASVGPDAEEMLRIVRERSDGEQDAVRLQLVCMS